MFRDTDVFVDYTNEHFVKKYEKIYNKMFMDYTAIMINKESYEHVDFVNNNAIVIKMVNKFSKDGEFKKEIKETRPDT